MISISKPFIDKIGITFYCHHPINKRQKVPFHIVDLRELFETECDYSERNSGKINSYRYMLWTKVTDEGVVAVKWCRFKKDGELDWRYLYVEFNPTKCLLPIKFMNYLCEYHYRIIDINSIDVAWDVKNVKVSDVQFIGNANSNVMTFGTIYGNSTKYLHPKANNGRIKVYDKYAERVAAKSRCPTIDSEKYKHVVRCEITYRNVGFLLSENDVVEEAIKGEFLSKYYSQVMIRGSPYVETPIPISDIDKFVLDSFLELDRKDLADRYIMSKGVNSRKNLKQYININHYFPLFSNDVSSVIQFINILRNDVYKYIPSVLI